MRLALFLDLRRDTCTWMSSNLKRNSNLLLSSTLDTVTYPRHNPKYLLLIPWCAKKCWVTVTLFRCTAAPANRGRSDSRYTSSIPLSDRLALPLSQPRRLRPVSKSCKRTANDALEFRGEYGGHQCGMSRENYVVIL